VLAERLLTERELLAGLPSPRASIGKMTTRKVDRPSVSRSRCPAVDIAEFRAKVKENYKAVAEQPPGTLQFEIAAGG
jgi:hypothetical protein